MTVPDRLLVETEDEKVTIQLDKLNGQTVQVEDASEAPNTIGAADEKLPRPTAAQLGKSVAVVYLIHTGELRKGNTIQQLAVTGALGEFRDQDYCGYLAYLDRKPQWLWEPGHGLARTREQDKIQLFQLIKNAHPGDLPTFDTPLEMALDSLSKVDAAGRRLIVLTDGDPVLQDTAILDRYEQAGIQIDVVHAEIHAPKYRETPQRMARRTGGKYIQIGRDKLDQAIPRVLAQRTRDCIASLASGQDD